MHSTCATFPRPRPLDVAASEAMAVQAPITGIVTAVASGGLLGWTTGSVIAALLGVVPGALAVIGTAWAAQYVAKRGATQVTPLLSPMTTNPDGKLVRLIAHGPPVD
jgi:uncharacterized membrane protein (Fun14 family)